MTSTKNKIQAPEKLPPDAITPIQFKLWKGQLLIFLKQNHENRRFLPGAIYEEWKPQDEEPERIEELDATDTPAEGQTGGGASRGKAG